MSRELLKQALEQLKRTRWASNCEAGYSNDPVIAALEADLAKPEPVVVPFPSFMRERIEEAIDLAINPKGMSTHDGKATVYASDLQRMISVIDLASTRKPWVGLTDEDTANICMQSDFNNWRDEQVIDAVEAKLKELNAAPTAQTGKEK